MTFISASSTLGATTFNNHTVTCNVGTLTNNMGLAITIVAVSGATGAVTNIAGLSFLEGNLNPLGNISSANVFYLTDAQRLLNIQRLALPPRVLLSWSNSGIPFHLESSTNLASPTNWQTNLTIPTIVGGQNFVTNSATNPFQFFQLKVQ